MNDNKGMENIIKQYNNHHSAIYIQGVKGFYSMIYNIVLIQPQLVYFNQSNQIVLHVNN